MAVLRVILYLIASYITISLLEYLLHRYIMHGNPGELSKFPFIGTLLADTAESHLEHHKNVNIDMTLVSQDESTGGLFFGWHLSVKFTAMLFFLYTLIGMSLPMVIAACSVVVHNFLWNNLHTRFHQYEHAIDFKNGLPTISSPTSFGKCVYIYLFKYHTIHHSQKGIKYNYNIIFPLFDHIFGTASNSYCIDNTGYCKVTSDFRCDQKQRHCLTNEDVNYGNYDSH
jgi:hypothetical protein